MKVSEEETKRIAALARIELNEKEVEELSGDLTRILNFAEKINELDTANVSETDHTLKIQNVTREDMEKPSMDHDLALGLGPKTEDGHYSVPAIIE